MLQKLRKYIYPRNIILDLIPTDAKILDLGCGQGDIFELLKNKKNVQYYKGIDPKLKFESINKNFELLTLKIENVITDISKFNCILMIDVLHHIKKNDQKSLIEKIINQLSAGSFLIYKDISNRNKFFSLMNKLHDLIYNREFINYYETDLIIDFIKEEKNISFNRFFHRIFWYDHEFLIIQK